MKEYKDYMSRISGGTELKNRIMDRITNHSQPRNNEEIIYHHAEYDDYEDRPVQEHSYFSDEISPKPRKSRRVFIAAISAVACVAGLIFGIFVLPGLLDRPAVLMPDEITENYATPIPEQPEYPVQSSGYLKFNFYEIAGYEWHDVTWDVAFNLPLEDEQVAVVFPNLEIELDWIGVMFDDDGNFVTVVAQESPATWQDFNRPVNVRTNINISRTEMPAHLVLLKPEDSPEPVISVVNGVEVIAIVYEGQGPIPQFDYSPPFDTVDIRLSFEMDGVLYRITITDDLVSGMHFASELVNQLTIGGVADLSIFDYLIMPAWGDYYIDTIEEAQNDPTFGRYVPNCPEGFELDWAHRSYSPHNNDLHLHWRPLGLPHINDHVRMVIQKADIFHDLHIIDINDRATWDWSYHPVFIDNDWRDALIGTPAWVSIMNPVFRAEDLSLDVIRARAHWQHPDVEFGWVIQRFSFSVLDGDTLTYISVDLVTFDADILWEMFRR